MKLIEQILTRPAMIDTRHIAGLLNPRKCAIEIEKIGDGDDDDDDCMEFETTSRTAIITVDGILGKHLDEWSIMFGGCPLEKIESQFHRAESDPSVNQILFKFNSPGGSVCGIPELAEQIFNSTKPTIAFTDSLCCSAAYYLASQCGAIFSTETAELGSVGVYSIYADQTKLFEQMGIKFNAISAGKYKLTGAPFKEMTDEERAMLQSEITELHEKFKAAVKRKRNVSDAMMEGQVFNGEKAVENVMCDGLVTTYNDLILLFSQYV